MKEAEGRTSPKRKGPDRGDRNDLRVDTYPVLKGLVDCLGGKLRPISRLIGTSYSHLWAMANHKKPPPTLEAMSVYANRVYIETGIRLVMTVTPDLRLYYSIQKSSDEFDEPFEPR